MLQEVINVMSVATKNILVILNNIKNQLTCDQCDYKGTSKSHLTSHVKSIHEGVHYPCDQCDYKAARTRYLHGHQLKNHN